MPPSPSATRRDKTEPTHDQRAGRLGHQDLLQRLGHHPLPQAVGVDLVRHQQISRVKRLVIARQNREQRRVRHDRVVSQDVVQRVNIDQLDALLLTMNTEPT